MNYCVNNTFGEFIIHITIQHSASERLVDWHRHQHQHWPHLWCCWTLCWPYFVGLNTTTNELLCKWHICWIYCTYHCTMFSIRKIGFSASVSASATPIVLLNGMLTPFCNPEYYNKWIIVYMTDLLNLLYMSLYSLWHQKHLFLSIRISISHTYIWCCHTLCQPIP